MKEIALSKGKIALVDDDDFERLSWFKWSFMPIGYASGKVYGVRVLMHRFIMSAPNGMYVDHINRNKLDNRKCNLRLCTPVENGRNRGKNKNNTSGFKGVFMHKRSGKWMARIWNNRKSIYLGSFNTPEEADESFRRAEKAMFGEFVRIEQ